MASVEADSRTLHPSAHRHGVQFHGTSLRPRRAAAALHAEPGFKIRLRCYASG